MDSTEPSPNNVTASNLFRLACMLDDEGYAVIARETVHAFEAEVEQFPWCFVGLLGGVVWTRCGGKGIVLVDGGDSRESEAVSVSGSKVEVDINSAIQKLQLRTGAARTIIKVGSGTGTWIRARNQLIGNLDLGRSAAYVCEGGVCKIVGLDDL